MVDFTGNDSDRAPCSEEQYIIRSRRRRKRCPFSRRTGRGVFCTRMDLRCGERMQFSRPLEPESERMLEKPHPCLRVCAAKRKANLLILGTRSLVTNQRLERFYRQGVCLPVFAESTDEAAVLLDNSKRNGFVINLVVCGSGLENDDSLSISDYILKRNFPAHVVPLADLSDDGLKQGTKN